MSELNRLNTFTIIEIHLLQAERNTTQSRRIRKCNFKLNEKQERRK